MDYLSYAVIIAYLAVMFLVGIFSGRRIKNTEDFLLAGRRLGLVLLTFTLAATHFGGGVVMGGIEYGMLYGTLGGMWYGISCGLGLLALAFVAPKLRDLSLFTAPEYLERRYGGKFVRLYTSILSLISLVGILSAQIISTQALLSIFGISPRIASIIATFIFIAYTYFGGMWAVTITDFLQLGIAAVGVIVIASVAPVRTGSVVYESLSALSILAIVLPTIMYTLIGQDFYQRVFSAKDAKTARNSSLLAALIVIAISFFPAFIGANLAGNDLNAAIAGLFSSIPQLLGAIFIVAVLGAIMSTADSLLSAASSHIIMDIFAPVLKGEKRQLFYSRISVLVIGFLALVISFAMPTIIDAIVFSYTIYTAAVFFPLVLGLFWKKGSRRAAGVSMVCSTAFVVLGFFFAPSGVPLEISGALVSLVLYVLLSVFLGDTSSSGVR
jgi:SSS family solute:Na+ symporter